MQTEPTYAMCVPNTPVQHYPELGLWVKREDQCCPGGPHFSKTRGVYAHIQKRPELIIGVLDTHHSQGGWAVAKACHLLGKQCINYYPVRKADAGKATASHPQGSWGDVLRPQQEAAERLGASLVPLQAGRSAVLYHAAKKGLHDVFARPYMMPNALKLPEMVTETAAEVLRTKLPPVTTVLISASSGTIAAGVISGLCQRGYLGRLIVHMGYSRSEVAVRNYMALMVAAYSNDLTKRGVHPGGLLWRQDFDTVDEGYSYGDTARPCGVEPPCPMNQFYDLKAFSWWVREGRAKYGEACMWNIG